MWTCRKCDQNALFGTYWLQRKHTKNNQLSLLQLYHKIINLNLPKKHCLFLLHYFYLLMRISSPFDSLPVVLSPCPVWRQVWENLVFQYPVKLQIMSCVGVSMSWKQSPTLFIALLFSLLCLHAAVPCQNASWICKFIGSLTSSWKLSLCLKQGMCLCQSHGDVAWVRISWEPDRIWHPILTSCFGMWLSLTECSTGGPEWVGPAHQG